MKRILLFLIALLLLLALPGCGGNGKNSTPSPSPTFAQENIDYSESQGMELDPETKLDKYNTEPVPEGKPLPVEPENATVTETEYHCTHVSTPGIRSLPQRIPPPSAPGSSRPPAPAPACSSCTCPCCQG